MPKTEFDGLPVIEVPDSEEITVAVKPEDIQEGDEADPEQTLDSSCAKAAARGR
jgi:hypothetical protein